MDSNGDSLSMNLWEGARVRLAGLTRADLPLMSRWHDDAGFLRLFDAEPTRPRSEDELARWLDDVQKNSRTFPFAIRRLTDNAFVGVVSIEDILWSHRVAWLSISIGDRANRGQGYGTEALRLALDFAFRELNLYRVQLTVFEYNIRAIALYEKLGFRREGVYREFMERDGRRYDMYLYGLLRREWSETPLF
jgi:RimJ/RimL family protein N-acetyltransferase